MLARARQPLIATRQPEVASLPAPVGGWNARDSIADMPGTDAVYMTNYFPTPSSVNLRGGSTVWATGMSGAVQSLFIYEGATTAKMFAADAGGLKFYDVTSTGAATPVVTTGISNAWWEYANISTAGGNFMYVANGVDKPYLYDGTNWQAIDGSGSPAITGVTTSTLEFPLLFKNRMWFIQTGTLIAWYLPTSSIGGVAQSLNLQSIAQDGGYLVAMGTWTIDAGYGMDDMLVFLTNTGEFIIYRGTDPASAATWALVGTWLLGAPVTARCMLKYGGDLLVNTLDGLIPMASALQSDRLDPRVAVSNKIQNAISLASTTYGSIKGWQIFYFPATNAILVNVPIPNAPQQYVMNTISLSWCNFTGWNANCWALFGNLPYFGASGTVYAAWDSTYADNGVIITGTVLQAFNYFEQRGIEKYFTRARPSILTNGNPTISIGLNVDYNIQDNSAPISYSGNAGARWDISTWDASFWGQDSTITNNWQGITGIGYCGALQFKSASIGLSINWAATDIVFQAGWAGV